MKSKLLVCILLLTLLSCSVFAGNDLTLTYRQLKTSRTFKVQLNAPSLSYCFQVRQDHETGLFILEAPPFLLANYNDRILVGELQDSGIFSLMLDPMSESLDIQGFKHGGNFKRIKNPSISPVLSGLVLSFDHLDAISLSPVFNPDSPYGFGLIGGTDNFFAGFILATQNGRMLSTATERYQVDWSQLGIGQHMAFSIIGAGAEEQVFGSLKLSGMVFMQNAWDLALGGGTTVGWKLKTGILNTEFAVGRKLGGYGVKLKTLSDSDNPMDSFTLEVKLGCQENPKVFIDLGYRSDTYEMPVYGGESQRRALEYKVGATYEGYSLSAISSTNFDRDKGKVSKTEYLLSIKAFEAKASLSLPLYRPIKEQSYIADAKLKVDTKHALLEISKGRTSLQFSWEYSIDDCTMKFAIDQDRLVTASMRFIGL